MFDHYVSCHGCPDRAAGCHGRCAGYQFRVRENEEKNRLQRDSSGTAKSRAEYYKRLEAMDSRAYKRRKRREPR